MIKHFACLSRITNIRRAGEQNGRAAAGRKLRELGSRSVRGCAPSRLATSIANDDSRRAGRATDRRNPGATTRHHAGAADLGRWRMGRHRQGSRRFTRRAGHRGRRPRFAAVLLEGTHAAEHGRRCRSHRASLSRSLEQEGCGADRLLAGRRRHAIRGESAAAQTRARVRMVAMLGLSDRAVFEFHLANWLPESDEGLAIAPELRRMSHIRGLCVYSDDDDESSCPQAASETLRAVSLPGGHHFGGDYDRVAALILEQLR